MYSFVDQPTNRLSAGSHFLLWAMRGWVLSASQNRCPTVTLAASFSRMGGLEILNDFHEFMIGCLALAKCRLAFGEPEEPHIMESEAIMLALWSDVVADRIDRARALLALMILETRVDEVIAHMVRTAAHLSTVGLAPAGLSHGSEAPQVSRRAA